MAELLPLVFLFLIAGTLYLLWAHFWGGVLVNGVRNLTTAMVVRRHWTDLSSVSEGRIAVTGRSASEGQTVTAPLTGTECLAYAVPMSVEAVDSADGTGGGGMRSVDEFEDTVTFRLEDGVGTARVDSTDAEFRLAEKDVVEGHYEDDLSEEVRSLMEQSEYDFDPVDAEIGAADVRSTTGKFRMKEHRLDEGTSTFLFGRATRDDRGETLLTDPDGTLSAVEDRVMEPFLITAESETPTDVWTYVFRIVVGAVMVLGPIWFAWNAQLG